MRLNFRLLLLAVVAGICLDNKTEQLGCGQKMPKKPILNPNTAENVIDSRNRKVPFVYMN